MSAHEPRFCGEKEQVSRGVKRGRARAEREAAHQLVETLCSAETGRASANDEDVNRGRGGGGHLVDQVARGCKLRRGEKEPASRRERGGVKDEVRESRRSRGELSFSSSKRWMSATIQATKPHSIFPSYKLVAAVGFPLPTSAE